MEDINVLNKKNYKEAFERLRTVHNLFEGVRILSETFKSIDDMETAIVSKKYEMDDYQKKLLEVEREYESANSELLATKLLLEQKVKEKQLIIEKAHEESKAILEMAKKERDKMFNDQLAEYEKLLKDIEDKENELEERKKQYMQEIQLDKEHMLRAVKAEKEKITTDIKESKQILSDIEGKIVNKTEELMELEAKVEKTKEFLKQIMA